MQLEDNCDNNQSAETIVIETSGQNVIPSYKIACDHPHVLCHVPASTIIMSHKASRFLDALHSYVVERNSRIIPHAHDVFSLWKQLEFRLPPIAEANNNKLKNVVRASPAVPAMGRRAAEPAHFDFALIRTGEPNNKTEGTSVQGTNDTQLGA